MRYLSFIALLILLTSSCVHKNITTLDEQMTAALETLSPVSNTDYFVFPKAGNYTAIPNQDPNNPITKEKVTLGQLLYFETGFAQASKYPAAMETYSCASCHIAEKGFTPGRIQGIGDGGIGFGVNGEVRAMWNIFDEEELDVQGVRPLSMINVAYVTNTFWNGQFGANDKNIGTEDSWDFHEEFKVNNLGLSGQESQHIIGIESHRLLVTEKLLDEYGYRPYFDAAFPEIAVEERYSTMMASFALAAYLRTIFADKAPFQDWLKGNKNALTQDQKKGALVFLTKAGCTGCHKSPSFNSMEFHRIGARDMYKHDGSLFTDAADDRNLGRGGFTRKPEDMRAFKVPQLYNVADYASYFHGSSLETLREVMNYKLRAKSENPFVSNADLSEKFKEIKLTAVEKENLLDFLTNALRDPDMTRYVPDNILSGNCFPNNDAFSKLDMGCE